MTTPLRIFPNPDGQAAAPKELPQVRVALRDVVSALVEASQQQRGWLEDFAEEEVTVSEDLYDVIMAYQYFCRSA